MQASYLHWPIWMEIQLQGTKKTYQKGTGTSQVGPVCMCVVLCTPDAGRLGHVLL